MRSKRFVIVYAVAVFLIVFLITFNSVCAIKRFEVYYEIGSATMEAKASEVQAALEDQYLNKSYLFFKKSNVADVVAKESAGYLEVISITKHFPNRITVSVRERYENFAFERDGKYYVVGDDGTVLAVKEENVNNIAGSNIEVKGIAFGEHSVGDMFQAAENYSQAYAALKSFFNELTGQGYRGNVTQIQYGTTGVSDPQYNYSYFYASTVEGVKFWIVKPEQDTLQKVKQLLEQYRELSDAERMEGYIYVGTQGASYSTNVPPELGDYIPE